MEIYHTNMGSDGHIPWLKCHYLFHNQAISLHTHFHFFTTQTLLPAVFAYFSSCVFRRLRQQCKEQTSSRTEMSLALWHWLSLGKLSQRRLNDVCHVLWKLPTNASKTNKVILQYMLIRLLDYQLFVLASNATTRERISGKLTTVSCKEFSSRRTHLAAL